MFFDILLEPVSRACCSLVLIVLKLALKLSARRISLWLRTCT